MSLIETVADDRVEHPVDAVERLAALNQWAFDRAEEDEISILVSGGWANYDVSFTWLPEMESLHVSCCFDLKSPPRQRPAIRELDAADQRAIVARPFRPVERTGSRDVPPLPVPCRRRDRQRSQCGAVVNAAVNACETYYQAFQFVLWADRPPREALAFAAFETSGSA